MKPLTKKMYAGILCTVMAMGISWASFGAAEAEEDTSGIKDHRIGFIETAIGWATYQTADGKTECPQGINANHGPREDFKLLYPNGGTLADTELSREALTVFPQDKPAQFPFFEIQGNTGIGLNLDGKVGPRDFTSPDGEKGIDNAFYRAIGCTQGFRGDGPLAASYPRYFLSPMTYAFNRMMIEISDVDSLQNDDSVEVTLYRGHDQVVLDATGIKVVPGGTQRIDMRFGEKLIRHMHGSIKDGVLTTDPIKDGLWPWILISQESSLIHIHDMRLRLKLSPTNAEGQIAGYFDMDSIRRWVNGYATGAQSQFHFDVAEFYWAMRRNADAYPDQNGVMTAISAALNVKMTQVFVIHPEDPKTKQVAALPNPEGPAGR